MSETQANSGADTRRAQLVVSKLPSGAVAVVPTDFDQVWRLASMFASSGEMVPPTYRDNPNACAMAIMWGMELGITPVQSLQGIAVINGRPGVWGDLQLAICKAHPDFEDVLDEVILDVETPIGYRVTATRRGKAPVVREFTIHDAKKARLTEKNGTPWQTYPIRMCFNRARSWALRDQYADALRGIASAEEMRDVIDGDAVELVREKKPAEPARQQVPMPTARAPMEALSPPEENPLAALDTLLARQREPVPAEGAAPADDDKGPQEVIGGDLVAITAGQRAVFDALLEAKGMTGADFVDGFGDYVHGLNYNSAIAWLQAVSK